MYLLDNYTDWRNCIEQKCGIPLTKTFVLDRLATLNNKADKSTQEFVERYGDNYRALIVTWFEKALQQLHA
jgi:hypothetical protein